MGGKAFSLFPLMLFLPSFPSLSLTYIWLSLLLAPLKLADG